MSMYLKKLKEINEILFNQWDPLDVNYNENLIHEYETYSYKLSVILNKNKLSEQEIINILKDFEINDIGILSDNNRKKITAHELFNLFKKE